MARPGSRFPEDGLRLGSRRFEVRDGRKGGITQRWVRFGRLYPFYPLNRFQSFFVLFVLFLLYCLLFLLFVFVLFGRTVGSHN